MGNKNIKNRVCQIYTFTKKAVANTQVKTTKERRIRAAAVYALKKVKDIPALKVVSQNLMDSILSITDGVYRILSKTDVREQRAEMGQKINPWETIDNETLVPLLEQLLAELKQKKHNKKIRCAF